MRDRGANGRPPAGHDRRRGRPHRAGGRRRRNSRATSAITPGLLSLAAMKGAGEDELIAHANAVAEEIPLVGFYLQPAVGGIVLPASFWRRFAAIDNVVAIKIAPFNRYRTLDVVRGVVEAGAADRVTLYTGNDDHIVLDLVTPLRDAAGGSRVTVRIKGGLLGHWSVWVQKAVELLDRAHARGRGRRGAGRSAGARLPGHGLQRRDLRRRQQVSWRHRRLPRNPAPAGPAGRHLVPRSERRRSGPGQKEEIDRVCAAYPHLNDDDFVRQNLRAVAGMMRHRELAADRRRAVHCQPRQTA